MLRRVPLPDGVPGGLFLHSMPGRMEAFSAARSAIVDQKIAEVVCLTPGSEVEERSPDYARAIAAGLPWKHISFPMEDHGVAEDPAAFQKLAATVAKSLRNGTNVLVHCTAGIGRTGTFAVAVLCELGQELHEARRVIKAAGSTAESQDQREFLERIY